ncbi:MAG: hypothetical protein HY558_04895 [Euryarchaeota archaeon]|nr:hypothetical protein [Euryarchaeota archaeon]
MAIERVSTGIAGLDAMTEGGFPRGYAISLLGGPGAGKTLFSTQFLMEGVKKGEKGLFVSYEVMRGQMQEEGLRLGWNLEESEKAGQMMFLGLPKFDTEPIGKAIQDMGVRRVVIDSLNVLSDITEKEGGELRTILRNFIIGLKLQNITSVLISEVDSAELTGLTFSKTDFIVDGVILLSTLLREETVIPTIKIVKMRGTRHDRQTRPFEFTPQGIKVHNTQTILKR